MYNATSERRGVETVAELWVEASEQSRHTRVPRYGTSSAHTTGGRDYPWMERDKYFVLRASTSSGVG